MHRRAAIALATTSRVAFQATPWRAALSGPCVSPFLAGFCGRSCFRLYASDSGSASGQDTRTSSTNASSREHPTTSYRVEGSLEYHYEEIQPRSKSFIKYHRFGRWLQSEASDSESIETTHGVRRSGIAMLGLSARRTDASRSASPAYGKGTERSSDFGSSQNNQSQGEEEKVTYDPTKTSFENEAYSAATRHYARYYEPPKYTPTAIYKRIQDRLTATKEQAAERFALLTARYRAFFARFRRKQSDSSSSTHQGGSSGGHLSEILPNPDTKLTVGAVTVAIGGNFLVFIGKLTAAWFSGSGVMFAEALHSLADIVNQALLMVGIQQARRKPDEAHPYGFAPARFVYALISATGVFFLGCGASLYHGIGQLFLEDHMVEMSLLTLSVLAGSFFVEASTLIYAIQVIRTLAKKERGGRGVSFWQYIRSGSDTTAIAVLVEDAVAVTGLAIAAVTLWLTHTTGDPIYDTIGTITVGLGMGYVAVFLIRRNAKMLLGQSLDRRTITDIVDVIRSRPSVHSVHDLKSISYGGIDTRFKAEIQFNGREIAKQVLFATAAPLQSSTTPAPADGSKTESDLRLPTTAGGIAARRILRLLDLSKDQHGFSQKQCEDMVSANEFLFRIIDMMPLDNLCTLLVSRHLLVACFLIVTVPYPFHIL